MLGRFSGPVPVMIYVGNLAIVSLLQSAIWYYATTNHRSGKQPAMAARCQAVVRRGTLVSGRSR